MPDSVSSTSLPFGADTHNHASWRRSRSISHSIPRSAPYSIHHEYQPAVYDRGPQTYSALVAEAQALDAASRLPNTHIAPSSIKSIPRSHKIVLRRHRILFRVLMVIFSVSIIAEAVAVVLGAVKANQQGQNGAKCAAIIVGVLGFSGMVSSAAVIWLIWTGRKVRARLEERWADEERVKEENSIRERRTESYLRKCIENRERSLSRSRSRSRSRGRDRDRDRDHDTITRPAVARIPSFQAMTPLSISSARMPDHDVQPVSRRGRSMGVSNDIDDQFDIADDDKDNNHEGIEHDGNKAIEDENSNDAQEAQAVQKQRDSASTLFQDLESLASESGDNDSNKVHPAIRSKIAISIPLDTTKALRAPPDPSPTSPIPLTSSSTYVNFSPLDSRSAPSKPPPQLPINAKLPPTLRSSTRHIRNPPAHDTTSPSIIVRWDSAKLGSAQSDENFQAMLDQPDDPGSEDEKERSSRRRDVEARVEAWVRAASEEVERGGKVRTVKGRMKRRERCSEG